MRSRPWLALLVAFPILLSPAHPTVAADAAPAAEGPLAAIAPYVGGEWRIDHKWDNGEALKARERFEWGLANKFVEVRTWVSRNDGSGAYERYRGVFGVKDGKLVSYNFSYNGENTVDEATVEGKVIKIRRVVTGATPMVIRQEVELLEPNRRRWRVWIERDGKTEQIMDGEWVRRSADAPAKKADKP